MSYNLTVSELLTQESSSVCCIPFTSNGDIGLHSGDHIRSTGGADRAANKGRAPDLRASWAAIRKLRDSSGRSNRFDSPSLYPDNSGAISPDNGESVRLIVDSAQIAEQFRIAIAAANVVL
jgi:hypothetical protein